MDLKKALKMMSKDSQKVSIAVAADYVRRWREEATERDRKLRPFVAADVSAPKSVRGACAF